MIVSVVISARNEFPSIVHTIQSIVCDLETFLDRGSFEIIIVDNLSDDDHRKEGMATGTTDFILVSSMYASGVVRILYDPIAGNVAARNKGAVIARGRYLFFSDAHMIYHGGSFKRMVDTIEESGGIVHPAVAWVGDYPPRPAYAHSWTPESETIEEWHYTRVAEEWFYVRAMGHCCVGMLREQFNEYQGYAEGLRGYGGGGMFLDTKWWMLGATVVTEPRVVTYHLSAPRRYMPREMDYIYNAFYCASALGADEWGQRVFVKYLRKIPEAVLANLREEANRAGAEQRRFINGRACYGFEELFQKMPWNGPLLMPRAGRV